MNAYTVEPADQPATDILRFCQSCPDPRLHHCYLKRTRRVGKHGKAVVEVKALCPACWELTKKLPCQDQGDAESRR